MITLILFNSNCNHRNVIALQWLCYLTCDMAYGLWLLLEETMDITRNFGLVVLRLWRTQKTIVEL